uniref:Uncharacterized protein n=1 Tax=Tolypothrix bouteillei VB521301 TaxID=1479485 RepID=A0A0C1QM99_9CYAN
MLSPKRMSEKFLGRYQSLTQPLKSTPCATSWESIRGNNRSWGNFPRLRCLTTTVAPFKKGDFEYPSPGFLSYGGVQISIKEMKHREKGELVLSAPLF